MNTIVVILGLVACLSAPASAQQRPNPLAGIWRRLSPVTAAHEDSSALLIFSANGFFAQQPDSLSEVKLAAVARTFTRNYRLADLHSIRGIRGAYYVMGSTLQREDLRVNMKRGQVGRLRSHDFRIDGNVLTLKTRGTFTETRFQRVH
jgi:hypothetical protein